ncbi:MAG: hypothetical protein WBA00_11260 [Rhodococcus sp. (in: high G+C Gram-positive bacteria)]
MSTDNETSTSTHTNGGGPRELMSWNCVEDNERGGLWVVGRTDGSTDYVDGDDIFIRHGYFYAEQLAGLPAADADRCGTGRGTVCLLLMMVLFGALVGCALYFAGGGI